MNDEDYALLEKEFVQSDFRSRAQYIRNRLLKRPVIFKIRNESVDELTEQICQLKEQLKAVSYYFEKTFEKITSFQSVEDIKQNLIDFELSRRVLFRKVEDIYLFMENCSANDRDCGDEQRFERIGTL